MIGEPVAQDDDVVVVRWSHSTNLGALGSLACVAMSCSIHNAAPVSFISAATFARDAFA